MSVARGSGKIEITGLRQFVRELRAMDAQYPGQMAAATRDMIHLILVPEARRRATAHHPKSAAHGEQSVRAAASRVYGAGVRGQNGKIKQFRAKKKGNQHWSDFVGTVRGLAEASRGQIALGQNSVPWAAGQEWGANRQTVRVSLSKRTPGKALGVGHTTQFPPKKKSGYVLWPSFIAQREVILGRYERALREVTRKAFSD